MVENSWIRQTLWTNSFPKRYFFLRTYGEIPAVAEYSLAVLVLPLCARSNVCNLSAVSRRGIFTIVCQSLRINFRQCPRRNIIQCSRLTIGIMVNYIVTCTIGMFIKHVFVPNQSEYLIIFCKKILSSNSIGKHWLLPRTCFCQFLI